MGSAFSRPASSVQSNLLVDAVNEVFEILDRMHSLHARESHRLECCVRKQAVHLKAKQQETKGEVIKKEEGGDGAAAMETDKGVRRKESNCNTNVEHGAPFARYRSPAVSKPKEGEDTLSDNIATGEMHGQDDDQLLPPLPPRSRSRNSMAAKAGDAKNPGPVKKRVGSSRAMGVKELDNGEDSKRQKKVPCKRCCLKTKTDLTDANGFFDQRAFGKWLKEGKCLEALHYPREVTIPVQNSLDLCRVSDTFDETETLPPTNCDEYSMPQIE